MAKIKREGKSSERSFKKTEGRQKKSDNPRFKSAGEDSDYKKPSRKTPASGNGFENKSRFKKPGAQPAAKGSSARTSRSKVKTEVPFDRSGKKPYSSKTDKGDESKRSFSRPKPASGSFDSKPRYKKPGASASGDSFRDKFKNNTPPSFGKAEKSARGNKDNREDSGKKPFNKKTEKDGNQDEPVLNAADKKSSSANYGKPFAKKPAKKVMYGIPKPNAQKTGTNAAPQPKSTEPKEGIRLNRYIANAGICSRREADQLIIEGLIKINGKVVSELGVIVKPGDSVKYGNKVLNPEKQVYVLLNKPKDFITTTNDPQERNTVMNLVANACKERIYPVGRLDRNTTGLLLFTNDGELAETLTHPSNKIKKIYQAELNRPISPEDAQAILDGLYFEEGKAIVDSMAVLDESRRVVGIEIHIGWNRIVRRVFEAKGYDVVKLDRVSYAGLTKKDLPRGHWRILSDKEVIMLKHFT